MEEARERFKGRGHNRSAPTRGQTSEKSSTGKDEKQPKLGEEKEERKLNNDSPRIHDIFRGNGAFFS